MPALSTTTGGASGGYLNDAYGSITAAGGTAFSRLVPPRADAYARVGSWLYINGATAHTITFMTCQGANKAVATDALSGQAVVTLNGLPVTDDGTLIAANDYITLQYEDGSWDKHIVSSLSGNSVTVTANFTQKVKAGTTCFFHGAPADHSSRQVTVPANGTLQFNGEGDKVVSATGRAAGEPLIVHSSNATNAGTMHWLSYHFTPASAA